MKRIVSFVIAAALVLCLCCGCSKTVKQPEMQTVADAVGAVVDISDMMQTPDSYVSGVMLIENTDYASRCTLISSVGTSIDEYGIFLANDEDGTAELEQALEDYLDYREELWMDEYLPDEKPKLDNAEVWCEGNYVMYAILGDAEREAAHSAFIACFEG